MLQDLHIEVSYSGKKNEIAIIDAKGYVDTITKEKLEKTLLDEIGNKKYKLVINLDKVSYVNSSGWGVFLREIKEIRDKKGDLVLVNMSPDVFQVFETMELSKIIKSFDSVDAAVKYFE